MKYASAWLVVLPLAMLAVSCQQRQEQLGGRGEATSSFQDSVKIVSISPRPDTPLRVGQTVTFEVKVKYKLAGADSGSITLVIQQGESGRLPLGSKTEVVQRGEGSQVLPKDVVVPDTTALQVFTPLTVQGTTSTNVVDTRVYRVLKS